MRKPRLNAEARHIAMSTLKKLESGALYSSLFTAFGASSRTVAVIMFRAFLGCRLLRFQIASIVPKIRK